MNINDIVEFKKTKNRYRIAGFGKMKDPGSGEWIDSVVYENFQTYVEKFGYVAPEKHEVFIREKEDFESKFELSIPKIQVFNYNPQTQTRQLIYDFGIGEFILSKYFDKGLGLRSAVKYTEEMGDLNMFCQTLAGDILIGEMRKADSRISQELLDEIKKDIKVGTFKKNVTGLSEIQSLLYFLAVPGDNNEEPKDAEEVMDTTETDETLEPKLEEPKAEEKDEDDQI